jgi:hypothetical protein
MTVMIVGSALSLVYCREYVPQLDETGTISFLISVLVPTTDQMITLPVVIYPTDASFEDYASYNEAGTFLGDVHAPMLTAATHGSVAASGPSSAFLGSGEAVEVPLRLP